MYLSADMEGISGVFNWAMTESDKPDWQRARELMTGDVNAAIQGARLAGATEILVKDSHGDGDNLLIERLEGGVTLIQGWGPQDLMMEGIEETFDAAVLVGYHARVLTEAGTLSHTMTGQTRGLWYNGIPVGETGISAAHAGRFGVPVVCVTGDDALALEARQCLGESVGTVVVKSAIAQECVAMCDPAEGQRRIREGVAQALEQPDKPAPFLAGQAVEVRMQFHKPGQAHAASRVPTVEREDELTVVAQTADGLEAANLVSVLLRVAPRR